MTKNSNFEFEVVTVNAEGKEKSRSPGRAEFFAEDLGNGVTLEMVKIPAGEFLMGTADADRDTIIRELTRYGVSQEDAEKYTGWEMHQHRVKVPEFWMGKYAVTQAQWSQVAGLPKVKLDLNPDPANFKGAKRPVEQVSWDEAVEFCDRLNRFVKSRFSYRTGKSYRLPSEAEWEYACRAGTTTSFYFGESITSDLVNLDGNHPYGNAPKGEHRQQTTDVGIFPPNGYGLYDMYGNVWEWCADQWFVGYANKPDQLKQNGSIAWTKETTGTAPKSKETKALLNQSMKRVLETLKPHSEVCKIISLFSNAETNYRLLRGGSWCDYPGYCRSAYRVRLGRAYRYLNVGFRVVCVVPR